MQAAQVAVTKSADVMVEDNGRAGMYRLLGHFLSAAPDLNSLSLAAGLKGDDTRLGRALNQFAQRCANVDAPAVATEYQDLFIGLGRGELIPFGSYYLTGFLHEKPLARLRRDMQQLGLAREDGVSEPEDHISSVCELMAGFIDGGHGVLLALDRQKAFFELHVGSWLPHFFRDLEASKTARLYADLGTLGSVFMGIEAEAFAIS